MIPLTNSFGQLLAVLLLHGVSSAIAMPATAALAVEEGRKFGMGTTMAMLFLAMSIGMAIGPILSGGIAELLGISSVFYFAAFLGVTGTVLFGFFTRQYQQKKKLPYS